MCYNQLCRYILRDVDYYLIIAIIMIEYLNTGSLALKKLSYKMISGPFNVLNTLGALLVGVLIACCLFGIITVQVFTYYTRFPDDKLYLKAIVRSFFDL